MCVLGQLCLCECLLFFFILDVEHRDLPGVDRGQRQVGRGGQCGSVWVSLGQCGSVWVSLGL